MLKQRSRKNQMDNDGVQLLASMLLCYPEFTAITYEPEKNMLHMSVALNIVPEEEDFTKFSHFLADSIGTFQSLEGIEDATIGTYMTGTGNAAFLRISRDVETLTRRELSLISSLVRDKYQDAIIEDKWIDENVDDSELAAFQEENLEHLLQGARQEKLQDKIVGVREQGQVRVYVR